jgi:hypothetical protein
MLKRGRVGNNIIVNFQWVAQRVYTISSWGQALMETIALSNNKIPAVATTLSRASSATLGLGQLALASTFSIFTCCQFLILLRLGFRGNFLSVLHPNLVSSPIKGILEILCYFLTNLINDPSSLKLQSPDQNLI